MNKTGGSEYEINLSCDDFELYEPCRKEEVPLLEVPKSCELLEILDGLTYIINDASYREFRHSTWFPVSMVYITGRRPVIGGELFYLIEIDQEAFNNE